MAYKVFTNGSVLNASEINDNLMNQSVAVFSNAAARTAAITSPVEGQLTYLEDTNLYATWTGSSWVSPFGLTLVKSQTIGSGVSSVTVTNAFSADYDSYKIIVSGGASSAANGALELKLGSASNGHNTNYIFNLWGASGVNAFSYVNQALFPYVGVADTNGLSMEMSLVNPFLNKITTGSANFSDSSGGGGTQIRQTSTTSFTDFTLYSAGGVTMTGGNIAVYGYRRTN